MAKELGLNMENEGNIYEQEGFLAKNYSNKWRKGNFDFGKAQKGVSNLIVNPYARKYQNQYGVKIPNDVRDAVVKNRLRAIMRRAKEGEF